MWRTCCSLYLRCSAVSGGQWMHFRENVHKVSFCTFCCPSWRTYHGVTCGGDVCNVVLSLSLDSFFVTFLPDFVRTDETSRSFSITAEQCLVKKTQNCRPKFLVCSLSLWNWWTWAFQVDNDRRTDDRLSEGRGHWHVIPFQILDNFCIFVNRWSYRIVSYRYCERRQLPLCPHLCT